MKIWGILAILLLVVGIFGAVDQNAVMRTELKRQAKSKDIQINSLIKVGERSSAAVKELEKGRQRDKHKLNDLQDQLDAIPEVEPLDEYCRPGCRPSLADKIGGEL